MFLPNVKICEVKNQILEIYPSSQDLIYEPNGFVGLFVNLTGMERVKHEFNINDEVETLQFLEVSEEGIKTNNLKLCGVIKIFIKKFNTMKQLINKYKNFYLVVGEEKNINFISGKSRATNKYNIFGGKRLYDETCIESAVREIDEELGLKFGSKIFKLVKMLIYRTKDIIKYQTFNVFCIKIIFPPLGAPALKAELNAFN